MYQQSPFSRFSKWVARTVGHPAAFGLALLVILLWATTGPIFGFTNTWQLFINSFTTIVTFLMVFLIQNTQNRDSVSVQIKLDELIRVIDGAHEALMDLEELEPHELERLRNRYEALARSARHDVRTGATDPSEDILAPRGPY